MMSIEEIKAKQKRVLMDAFNNGNMDAWDEILARDFVFHLPPNPDIRGLNAFKQFITAMFQGYSERKYEIDEIIGEGNTTAYRYIMRMKHTGVSAAFRVPPTGREIVYTSGVFMHWKDGKVSEAFENADYLGILQQMGVIPPMGKK
jgi:predicted ester cyclase